MVSEPSCGQVEGMAHSVVLKAYEHSLQARAHYLPYNVPLRQDPKRIEIIRKMLEKVEHLEELCAKYSAVDHNKKDKKIGRASCRERVSSPV